jgi:2-haloacid dehalogenase
MKTYKLIIIDADDTLLDYERDERTAFSALFKELNVPCTEDFEKECHALSRAVWEKVGLNDVDKREIRAVWHELYRTHVTELFMRIQEKLSQKIEPAYCAARLLTLLCERGHLMPTVEETLPKLKEKGYRLVVLTNGISKIQRGRLREIERYFDKIYVSEEENLMKPQPELFNRILSDFSVKAEECIMLGDSLKSDILGAKTVGIDSCLVRVKGQAETAQSTYSVEEFSSVLAFL